jgi:hypothetical protein
MSSRTYGHLIPDILIYVAQVPILDSRKLLATWNVNTTIFSRRNRALSVIPASGITVFMHFFTSFPQPVTRKIRQNILRVLDADIPVLQPT